MKFFLAMVALAATASAVGESSHGGNAVWGGGQAKTWSPAEVNAAREQHLSEYNRIYKERLGALSNALKHNPGQGGQHGQGAQHGQGGQHGQGDISGSYLGRGGSNIQEGHYDDRQHGGNYQATGAHHGGHYQVPAIQHGGHYQAPAVQHGGHYQAPAIQHGGHYQAPAVQQGHAHQISAPAHQNVGHHDHSQGNQRQWTYADFEKERSAHLEEHSRQYQAALKAASQANSRNPQSGGHQDDGSYDARKYEQQGQH